MPAAVKTAAFRPKRDNAKMLERFLFSVDAKPF
jgi:hypothetical protein